jgi:hypothetical protein
MSNRHPAEERTSISDLRHNGRIDARTKAPEWGKVSPEECKRLRRVLLDGEMSIRKARAEVLESGVMESSLLRHASGECAHDHDVPAVSYDHDSHTGVRADE